MYKISFLEKGKIKFSFCVVHQLIFISNIKFLRFLRVIQEEDARIPFRRVIFKGPQWSQRYVTVSIRLRDYRSNKHQIKINLCTFRKINSLYFDNHFQLTKGMGMITKDYLLLLTQLIQIPHLLIHNNFNTIDFLFRYRHHNHHYFIFLTHTQNAKYLKTTQKKRKMYQFSLKTAQGNIIYILCHFLHARRHRSRRYTQFSKSVCFTVCLWLSLLQLRGMVLIKFSCKTCRLSFFFVRCVRQLTYLQ